MCFLYRQTFFFLPKVLHFQKEYSAPSHCFVTEIGRGNIRWEGVIESAIKAGVKSYVVEQDTCPGDPFDSLKISSDYLHANFI